MDRKKLIKQLIARDRGVKSSEEYDQYTLENSQPLIKIETLFVCADVILKGVLPKPGDCAMLSAAWAACLNNYDIPAIAVAGDLKIEKFWIFKCKENIPFSGNSKKDIIKTWDGHCWIEIDGFVGDLSLFRTAYSNSIPVLKSFVLKNFGQGKRVLINKADDLENQSMKYIPKYVLTEGRIDRLIQGYRKNL